MRDLFISHSSTDAETAKSLVRDFEKRGITCWLSSRDIPVGSSYQSEIVRAIENSQAMLLLFSAAANESEHVLRELELAAESRKPIYPLRIDPAEPSGGLKYMLANKQWVERKALGNRLVDTIDKLLKAAASQASVAPVPPPPSPPAVGLRLPAVLGAGLVAIAIVVTAGAYVAVNRQPAPPLLPPVAEQPKPAAVERTAVAQQPAPAPEPASARSAAAVTVLDSAPQNPGALGTGAHYFRDCTVCPVMAVVPAGSNLIGSPSDEPGRGTEEGPQKMVTLREPFALGRSEVTFDEWFVCVAEGGCNAYRPGDYEWGTGERPVINVSWNDAKAYVAWLSKKTGADYRLPSEAEWEFAARGCTSLCPSLSFWFGNDIEPARANYDWRFAYAGSPKAQALRKTVPANSGAANAFGLLNVHGNVREWVQDCWNTTLAGIPETGRARESGDCRARVVRGGSWADEPGDLRSAKRSWEVIEERRAQIGFRVARSFAR